MPKEELELIDTVRNLDETGPGPDGEYLQQLCTGLAASTDTFHHAVEETTLRWLLKSMIGPSPAAELLRRYPATWTILACVFKKIPLFPLAKSLADRKFVTVLRQTFEDLSKPETSDRSPASPKRKTVSTVGFNLDVLRALDGCLQAASDVFKALQSLLDRAESVPSDDVRAKIGAQHIYSLFRHRAVEMARIAGPALTVCASLVGSSEHQTNGAEEWIQVISAIWDLHLKGADDQSEVVIHLFRPTAAILSRIGSFPSHDQVDLPESIKARWSADLETFMHKNLIIPSRASFVAQNVLDSFTQALEVSKNILEQSALALYFLSSTLPNYKNQGKMRKDHVEWLKQTFRAIEQCVRDRPNAGALMQNILEVAIQRSTTVGVEDLQQVCRAYALQKSTTDWELVEKIATCDPDVFHLSDDGLDLRETICDRILKRDNRKANYEPVAKMMGAILQGFRIRRSLPSFLRLWFVQLSEAEQRQAHDFSPWFDMDYLTRSKQSLGASLETDISPSQLLDVITWVETQNHIQHPRSTCVFAAVLAQALHTESYISLVDHKLYGLVAPFDGSGDASVLKWRVVSRTMSWVAPPTRASMWDAVKEKLSDILRNASIESSITFEAFKCCIRAWDSLSLDDKHGEEVALLAESFTDRITAGIAGRPSLEADVLPLMESDVDSKFQEENAHLQYLAWYLNGSSRLSRVLYDRIGKMPSLLVNILASKKGEYDGLKALWHTVLRNGVNMDESKVARVLIDQRIVSLEASKDTKGWPDKQSLLSIEILSSISSETFTREQRERIMSVVSKRRSKMVQKPDRVPLASWKAVLSLATKMMGRATFYDGMSFSHLVDFAHALPGVSIESSDNGEAVADVIGRFFLMATATIRQMAENVDERSIRYFSEVSDFVSVCRKRQSEAGKFDDPVLMTLLKALVTELPRSSGWRDVSAVASLGVDAQGALATGIVDVLRKLVSDKLMLNSPDSASDFILFASADAATHAGNIADESIDSTSLAVQELDERSQQLMREGNVRAWTVQVLLRRILSSSLKASRPSSYNGLESLPRRLARPLLTDLVNATLRTLDISEKCQYTLELIEKFDDGSDTSGQALAIQTAVDLLIESPEIRERDEDRNLARIHGELTLLLTRGSGHQGQICRVIRNLLEKTPQRMGQWNIDSTLGAIAHLTSPKGDANPTPFVEMCKLAEMIIKKHRLRIEGHWHLLICSLQALLCCLVIREIPASQGDESRQVASAHAFGRLITLICEPSAGAVSRSQVHGALDSATNAAKRSAGLFMYLILSRYATLQLENDIPKAARDALEPAMNSIFDITPPNTRKILNDTSDSSGRAILREMYKRYVKFGKWSGV